MARHANATEVRAQLGRKENSFVLQVEDNGRGIDECEREDPKSFGIIGIHERVGMLGGTAAVTRRPEGGTRVCVRIPLQSEKGWSGLERRRGRERRKLSDRRSACGKSATG